MTIFKKVRVRVAPSPTGDPHVGTAYVTLFNYVFAKKYKGSLILRMEDTDQTRARKSSESQIYQSLKWLGLKWDEGPDVGGKYGPYRQSERKHIHIEHAHKLLENEKAYHCFCDSKRLASVREKQRAEGKNPRYDGYCKSLSATEIKSRLSNNETYVIRMKTPESGVTSFIDELRGEIQIQNSQLDDQILIKSDGFPTYHLANVVDDHMMEISHVMRAEEWISSTPKHVLLYQAFGWEIPRFVHLPLLRNADKSKISKRKNPVSLNYYKRKGILPEAMVNYLALMGWSFGDDIEFFTPHEMTKKFELKQISLGGPIFDIKKLTHINQRYIQNLNEEQFVKHLMTEMFSTEKLKKLYPLYKERLGCFEEFIEKSAFFFTGEIDYSNLTIVPKGKENKEFKNMLLKLLEKIDLLDEWNEKNIHEVIDSVKSELAWKPKDVFMPIRLITTGRKDSPPLAESLAVLGKEIVRYRLQDAANKLK